MTLWFTFDMCWYIFHYKKNLSFLTGPQNAPINCTGQICIVKNIIAHKHLFLSLTTVKLNVSTLLKFFLKCVCAIGMYFLLYSTESTWLLKSLYNIYYSLFTDIKCWIRPVARGGGVRGVQKHRSKMVHNFGQNSPLSPKKMRKKVHFHPKMHAKWSTFSPKPGKKVHLK